MNKKIFPSNFLQVIIFIILSFLCVFIVYQFDSNILNNYSLSFRMAFETLFFILLPLLLFLGINYNKNLKINFYYNKSLISFFILGSFIVSSVILFSFSIKSLFNSDILYFSPYTYNNMWMLIATCLIGPILEEIYFREIIQKGLSQSYSPKVSIILTSLIFTIVHMPSQYPLALFISLFLGYGTPNKTSSVRKGIILILL